MTVTSPCPPCPWCGAKGSIIIEGDWDSLRCNWECGSRKHGYKPWQSDACRFNQCEHTIQSLRRMLNVARSVNLPEAMKLLLTEVAFKAGEISHGRAAELLGIRVDEFKDKGWVQGPGLDELLERSHRLAAVQKSLCKLWSLMECHLRSWLPVTDDYRHAYQILLDAKEHEA